MRHSGRFLLLALSVSLLACDAREPAGHGEFIERAVKHYAQVERELLAADTVHLSPDQNYARARLISELETYRENRNFTVNVDFPGARVPYFVDEEGRRCAVAHLLHRFGRDELVAEVAAADNHAYVSDLAGHPELVAWLDEVGISPWEAVRIQVPGSVPTEEETPNDGPGDEPPTTIPDESDDPGAPPTSSPGAEETGPGAAPGTEETGPGPAPGTARGPSPSSPAGGGRLGRPGGPGRPGGRSSSPRHGAGSWWLWWELNKLDYLTANSLRLSTGPVTGERTPGAADELQERMLEKRRLNSMPALLYPLPPSPRGSVRLARRKAPGTGLPLLVTTRPATRASLSCASTARRT
jgi:hypothetical protein